MAIGKTTACLRCAAAMWAAEVKFEVRHEHLRKGCMGTLMLTDEGVSFSGPKKHVWSWKYADIQQLTLAPRRIEVLTYKENRWKLGADREYEFRGEVPRELYGFLRAKLDQRFVAEVADVGSGGWSLPVKRLGRVRGTEGVLRFGPESVVYETPAKDGSRSWRYQDIAGISSSSPFQLTITSFERAKSHYGDRKGFNFQLKAALDEARYNQLWLDIETKNGRIKR